jgi:hypothetical protein
MVGDYACFYFCPRSIMLYLFHMKNHPELQYFGGQEPILHLKADLAQSVDWADEQGWQWAFSDRHAAAATADFYNDLAELDQIDWTAVNAVSWTEYKERKQAEFLLQDSFPFELIEEIGVHNEEVRYQVDAVLANALHRPLVRLRPQWYY